ncbi:MAG: hypothetical protein ACR2LI_15925 [Propionibacteriaceae bacterium]
MIAVTRPTVLDREDMPAHPSQLPCGRCGEIWGEHSTSSAEGHGFVRPGLPRGYAFVDDLRASHRFAFLTGRSEGPARVVRRVDPCHADHLVRIESAADGFEAATHWLRTSTIVRLFEG